MREDRWTFRVADGSIAAADYADAADLVRVTIARARASAAHDVQLNLPRLRLRAHHRYVIECRIRADAPRRCGVGLALAHEPWSNLGVYRDIALTPTWSAIDETFVAADNEADARVHFDLGGSEIAVEIADVRLRDLSDGVEVEPTPSEQTEAADGAVILMYHRVARDECDPWSLCVSPERFADQLDVLNRLARPTTLDDLAAALAAGTVPPRTVVVTFDDGYADNWLAAAPILREARIPATFFVTSGFVGAARELWWDELAAALMTSDPLPPVLELAIAGQTYRWELTSPAPAQRRDVYLAIWQLLHALPEARQHRALEEIWQWSGRLPADLRQTHRAVSHDELIALSKLDGVRIGAHTVTHPALPAQPHTVQRYELLHSKRALEQWLDMPVTAVSYPYGAHDADTARLASELGYRVGCSTAPRAATPASDPLRLPRIQAMDWDADTFSDRLASWFPAAG